MTLTEAAPAPGVGPFHPNGAGHDLHADDPTSPTTTVEHRDPPDQRRGGSGPT
jgi:hypothetical protein